MGLCQSHEDDVIDADDGFEGLQSSSEIARRLRHVLDLAHRVLDEDSLPFIDLIRVVRRISRVSKAMRLANPEVITQECLQDGCKPLSSAEEARQLASYVYHAQLVYESDTDVVRHRLTTCGMMLIQHNKENNTGRVANYFAIDPRQKIAVLAIRGTSTFEDAITDIIAETEPLHIVGQKVLNAVLVAGSLRASAHEGFRLAAYGVLHQVEPVILHFLQPLGYQLILCGHSLGAGTACCLSKILHDRLFYTRPHMLRCFAYATPPCLDKDTALSMVPYTTSVVHHDDFVTRASLYNAKLMSTIWKEAKRLMDDDEFEECDPLSVVHRLQRIVKLDPKDDLFVAGRVVFVYKLGYPRRRDPVQYKATTKDGTLSRLRCFSFSRTSLTDHSCSRYIAALEQVASRLIGTTGRSAEEFQPWGEDKQIGPQDAPHCNIFFEDTRFSSPQPLPCGPPVTPVLPTLLTSRQPQGLHDGKSQC